MQTVWYLLAAIVGALLGFFLKGALSKEKSAHAEQENARLSAELASLKDALQKARAESEARASFEALATERQSAIIRLESERSGLREELRVKGDIERDQAASISKLEADLKNERAGLAEKVAILENAKQALAHQFEALAGKILDEKSKTFSDANKTELGHLLTPLREQITEFRTKVEQAQTDSKTGVTKLETLIGTLGGLNVQLAEEARNLTLALRGSSKAQGDWGEFILRDLLEKAGLREGEQYTFQQSHTGLAGEDERSRTARTDVIVSLPGGRSLIIDSKVSLVAYTDFANAATDDDRKAALKLHLASVRGHVGGLSKAGYHRLPGVESPDFVVLFVPIEPAFMLALQGDAELWADAYKQGILLVGPTTLLYVIRIVNVLWQQELQARSVQDVMNRGAELYDKFVNFVTDLQKVGDSLHAADNNYSNAMKKLSEGRGNLVRQVEMLKQSGIRTNKSLPPNLLDASAGDETLLSLAAESAPDHGEPGSR